MINRECKHRRLRHPRAAPAHAAAPSSTGGDSRASLGPLARPPASRCTHTRAPTGPRAHPAARPPGTRRLPGLGAGPGGTDAPRGRASEPGEGTRAGAGRCPAHVGGREQLKVRSGAWAVLSRAALARAAAAAKEAEEEGGGGGGGDGGGGGKRRGADGGGVGLEPSGGASCPGRCLELARRAPTPELHPAVPSSARVCAPAGSAPGLPPE